MMKSMLFFVAVICALYAPIDAFSPTFKTARVVPGVKAAHMRQAIVMRMSEEEKPAETEGAVAPAKGEAFYDDEYNSEPVKAGISDSMRQKLMAEAATGLDSEKKQTNVLLYIMGAVGLLVILGGQGIFF